MRWMRMGLAQKAEPCSNSCSNPVQAYQDIGLNQQPRLGELNREAR